MTQRIFHDIPYTNLIQRVLQHGTWIPSRNSRVLSSFGEHVSFDLKDYTLPLLTTKRVPVKTVTRELAWFLRGQTDARILQDQNVHIWDGNATDEFQASRQISRPAHDLGPIYGYQWNSWNKPYTSCEESNNINCDENNMSHLNQINDNVQSIMNDPFSRRHIFTAWNPQQIPEMTLPPCHILGQWNVRPSSESAKYNRLDLQIYQRSADLGLGLPFNMASYGLFLMMMCQLTRTLPGVLSFALGNCHIYENHIEALSKQITRFPYPAPFFQWNHQKGEALSSHTQFDETWFSIVDYDHHPTVAMDMIA